MNFWNQLIGEPKPATVKTEIYLHSFSPSKIVQLVKAGLVTRDEVIESRVVEAMFGDELFDYIYPRDLHYEEVTEILNRRYADKLRTESGENP